MSALEQVAAMYHSTPLRCVSKTLWLTDYAVWLRYVSSVPALCTESLVSCGWSRSTEGYRRAR